MTKLPFADRAEGQDGCSPPVCLAPPAYFVAVGERYNDFRQAEDAEVERLLKESRLATVTR